MKKFILIEEVHTGGKIILNTDHILYVMETVTPKGTTFFMDDGTSHSTGAKTWDYVDELVQGS